jgi:rod shape determining protein RodA
MRFDRRTLISFDWGLFLSLMIVPAIGLVVLFSAGYDPDASRPYFSWLPSWVKSQAFVKQSIFIMLGLCVMTVSMSLSPHFLQRFSWLVYGVALVLLVLVALFGTVVNGSQRWLSFGSFNLQPAELMKLGVVLALARYLSRNPPPEGGYRLRHLIIPGVIFAVPMAFIMEQPDLGTALVVGAASGMMLLFVGVHWRTLAFLAISGVALAIPAWSNLRGYQKNRIISLFNPELDLKGTGYHINQSKIAVGSGGMFGKGYLEGTQTQLEFLPEHTTDFIFSVLAEEWGFAGCVGVLCAYFFFIAMLLRVAYRAKDLYASLMVFGITSVIFFHATVNMGMVVGLLPVVGIPLPLFSYGGSSVLSIMFAVGLVFGVSIRRFRV